jgi:hypothetical protein
MNGVIEEERVELLSYSSLFGKLFFSLQNTHILTQLSLHVNVTHQKVTCYCELLHDLLRVIEKRHKILMRSGNNYTQTHTLIT